MTAHERRTKIMMERSGIVLLAVGILSSICVYFGHSWYHTKFLTMLGLGQALGDAIGSFFIIATVFIGQRLVSLAIFDDLDFGLIRSVQKLQSNNDEMKAEISELDQLASTDRLTGAWNRRRLEELVGGEIERLSRYDQALSMLMIDIDHFKSINDRYGHSVGDRVLVELTGVLQSSLRTSDSLTRWGGEEFIVLCPNTTLTTAVILARRLRELIDRSDFAAVGDVKVSIGVAECLGKEEWLEWFCRADNALYRAKANGRNQVQYASETPVRSHAEGGRSDGLVQLTWHGAYECGHGEIDREHQALFSISNDLLNAVFAGRSVEEIGGNIELLILETATHFRNEEAIIRAAGFPYVTNHMDKHRDLLNKAENLKREFEAGTLEIGTLFQFLAFDVVARHMLEEDRSFFSYLVGRDLGDAPRRQISAANR